MFVLFGVQVLKVCSSYRRSEELRDSVDQLTRSIQQEETQKVESQHQFLAGIVTVSLGH